jgi:RNA polymerase sigma factor (sigma-70 family)
VTQNVILILVKKEKEYNPNKSFYSWGMKICNFQIRGYLTKRKRNREDIIFGETCSLDSLGFHFKKMPFQDILEEEKRKALSEMTNLLTKQEKIVMELSFEGWGVQDIMYRLKMTRNTFNTAKCRAVKKAKKYFKDKKIQDYKA